MAVVRLNEQQLLLVEKILEKLDHVGEILDRMEQRMQQNSKRMQESWVQWQDEEDEDKAVEGEEIQKSVMQEENEEKVMVSTGNDLVWEDQAMVEGVEKAATESLAVLTEAVLKETPKEITPSILRNSSPPLRILFLPSINMPSYISTIPFQFNQRCRDASIRLVWQPPWKTSITDLAAMDSTEETQKSRVYEENGTKDEEEIVKEGKKRELEVEEIVAVATVSLSKPIFPLAKLKRQHWGRIADLRDGDALFSGCALAYTRERVFDSGGGEFQDLRSSPSSFAPDCQFLYNPLSFPRKYIVQNQSPHPFSEVDRIPKFLVIRHRGHSMNVLQSSNKKMRAIKENSITSFDIASSFPLDFIEVDVQVTKDGCIVIVYDDMILSENNGTVFERRVTEFSLAIFLCCGAQSEHSKERSTLLKKFKDGKILKWDVGTDDPLFTLQEAFMQVEPTLGFNIELKFHIHIIYQPDCLIHVIQATWKFNFHKRVVIPKRILEKMAQVAVRQKLVLSRISRNFLLSDCNFLLSSSDFLRVFIGDITKVKGEGSWIGIDLGTTYSYLRVWQHAQQEIKANITVAALAMDERHTNSIGLMKIVEVGCMFESAENLMGRKLFAHYLFDVLPLKGVFEPFDRERERTHVGMNYDDQDIMDDWLTEELDNYSDDDYLIFGCPGQIEFCSHVPVRRNFVDQLKHKNLKAVGHGISSSLLERVHEVTKQFFAPPMEEKQKYAQAVNEAEEYGYDVVVSQKQVLDWSYHLALIVFREGQRRLELWAQNPTHLGEIFHEYGTQIKSVMEYKAMAKSLKVEEDSFSKKNFESVH